jgi:hypothetical protein
MSYGNTAAQNAGRYPHAGEYSPAAQRYHKLYQKLNVFGLIRAVAMRRKSASSSGYSDEPVAHAVFVIVSPGDGAVARDGVRVGVGRIRHVQAR